MRVIFVTVADDRRGLESLTRLLFSTFPGSTVYQHGSVANAIRDVLHNRVDALFVRAAHGHEMLQMLRRQKPELPVFLLTDGEDTCVPYSDTGQEILDALRPAIAATAQSPPTRSRAAPRRAQEPQFTHG